MTESTPSTTDDKTDAPKAKASPLRDFVVVTDMLVYRVGKAKNEVRKFKRGAKLRLDRTDERTKNLLRLKSIVPASQPAIRTTPRVSAAAQGSVGDPVQAPAEAVQPITPTNTTPVNPNE